MHSRASWHDDTRSGRPIEIKSCRHTHADGQPGNFKAYRQYHEKPQSVGGRYGFAVYRV